MARQSGLFEKVDELLHFNQDLTTQFSTYQDKSLVDAGISLENTLLQL